MEKLTVVPLKRGETVSKFTTIEDQQDDMLIQGHMQKRDSKKNKKNIKKLKQ